MSGYRVRQEILETLGHFWTESYGQIYPTLARLEAAGLVGRDDDARFTLTDAGRARLRELLRTPPEPAPPRDGVLLRLFLGRQLGPDDALALLTHTEQEVRRRIAALEQIRATLDPDHPDERWALLTLDAGLHRGRATLDWITESRERITSWTG